MRMICIDDALKPGQTLSIGDETLSYGLQKRQKVLPALDLGRPGLLAFRFLYEYKTVFGDIDDHPVTRAEFSGNNLLR